MDIKTSKVQRWKGMTDKVHGVEVETLSRTLRTICGIPVLQRVVILSDGRGGEQFTCQVCRDILHER